MKKSKQGTSRTHSGNTQEYFKNIYEKLELEVRYFGTNAFEMHVVFLLVCLFSPLTLFVTQIQRQTGKKRALSCWFTPQIPGIVWPKLNSSLQLRKGRKPLEPAQLPPRGCEAGVRMQN